MRSFANKNRTWKENFKNTEVFSLVFTKVFLDQTATKLKCSALVVYPVRVVILNFPSQFRRWLVQNGPTIIRFLSFRCSSSEIKWDHGELGIDELSTYGFSTSILLLPSITVWLTSILATRKKNTMILQEA